MCCRASASVSVECAGQAIDANHAVEILAVSRHSAGAQGTTISSPWIGEEWRRGSLPRGSDVFVLRRRSYPRPKGAWSISPPSSPRQATDSPAKVHKDPRFVELILSESVARRAVKAGRP